jgi:hypothetical protein
VFPFQKSWSLGNEEKGYYVFITGNLPGPPIILYPWELTRVYLEWDELPLLVWSRVGNKKYTAMKIIEQSIPWYQQSL